MNRRRTLAVCLILGGAACVSNMVASPAIGDPNVVIILDDSGSMQGPIGRVRKMLAAKQALQTVLADLPDVAQVGLLALNSRGPDADHWIIPLGPLDRDQLSDAIRRIGARGGTPLGAAMKTAADALLELRQRSPYGDFRLLIVSDGEAHDEELVDDFLPQIMARKLTVEVIGVAMSDRHSLAWRVHKYRTADDPESLQTAIQASLAEVTIDDADENAVDFELVAALPTEVAEAVLVELTREDNRPLAMPGEELDEAEDIGPPGTPVVRVTNSTQQPSTGSPSPAWRLGTVAMIVLTVAVLKTVMRASTSRR